MSRQNITREEFKVSIRTSLGTTRTEWASTEARVAQLRERFDVVGVELAFRVLDF